MENSIRRQRKPHFVITAAPLSMSFTNAMLCSDHYQFCQCGSQQHIRSRLMSALLIGRDCRTGQR